jgi:hypothetical protein
MNILELLERLGGEILSNKARAVVDGKIVILARMDGAEWVYTPEGQDLANAHSNAVVDEAAAKTAAKPARAKKAEATPEAPAAVELADVEPEL